MLVNYTFCKESQFNIESQILSSSVHKMCVFVMDEYIQSIMAAQFVNIAPSRITKGSTQKMYKYSLYNNTRLIKPNP